MCTIVDMHDGYGYGNNHAKQKQKVSVIPFHIILHLLLQNGYYLLYTNKHQRDLINLIRGL